MNWWFAHIICHHNRISAINHAHSFKVANKVIHTYIEIMHLAFTCFYKITHHWDTTVTHVWCSHQGCSEDHNFMGRELGRWRGKMTDFHPFFGYDSPVGVALLLVVEIPLKRTNKTHFFMPYTINHKVFITEKSLWTHHLDAEKIQWEFFQHSLLAPLGL